METFLLGTLIFLVAFVIIYSTIKTKKIYDENIEYEPKNEDEIKRIEKRLILKGYKFRTIQKYEYHYLLNGIKEKMLLPRIRVYSKRLKKYGLLLNNGTTSIKENLLLKKQALEFLNSKKLNGIIIFNEKSSDFEFIKVKKEKIKLTLICILFVLIFLILYFFKNEIFKYMK